MKVNFWTSTEYGGFMGDLVQEMNNAGCPTRRRFLISEASYRSAKSKPARLWLRLRQYALYPLYLTGSLLFGRKADVVVVTTNPFYAPLIATLFHKRVVHLVYDLFPEAFLHSQEGDGSSKLGDGEGFVCRGCRWVVGATLRRAEVNVFLGERLRAYVESVYGQVPNSAIIPVGAARFARGENLECGRETRCERTCHAVACEGGSCRFGEERIRVADAGPLSANSELPSSHDEVVTILYCGNLGRMHDLETLAGFWREEGGHEKARKDTKREGERNNETTLRYGSGQAEGIVVTEGKEKKATKTHKEARERPHAGGGRFWGAVT